MGVLLTEPIEQLNIDSVNSVVPCAGVPIACKWKARIVRAPG
jgi:hypothetical protein